MKQNYEDITKRLGWPIWWDEVGVPRYETFEPKMTNNIYAAEVVLLKIKCQGCGQHFRVALSATARSKSLKEKITSGAIDYGDPPNAECCLAGATMSSIGLQVFEYWSRGDAEWSRNKEFEVRLYD